MNAIREFCGRYERDNVCNMSETACLGDGAFIRPSSIPVWARCLDGHEPRYNRCIHELHRIRLPSGLYHWQKKAANPPERITFWMRSTRSIAPWSIAWIHGQRIPDFCKEWRKSWPSVRLMGLTSL